MTSRHFHDTYELYYLLEGERYYFIDKETYLVKQG
ncbi:MAG: AraC family ligand binding domain-containing protein, partial [Hungatella sp.]